MKDIIASLYADLPDETLYHYTNLKGLLGIVESRVLWASDIRYMNDASELKHTVDLIRIEIRQRIAKGHPNPRLLDQFFSEVQSSYHAVPYTQAGQRV